MEFPSPRTERFSIPCIDLQRKYWQDDTIWEIVDDYPGLVKRGFVQLKKALHHYIARTIYGDIQEPQHTCLLPESFFKSFYFELCRTEDLELSFVKAKGVQFDLGYYWALYKLRQYHKTHYGEPIHDFEFTNSFYYACKSGKLKRFGITQYIELYKRALKGIIKQGPSRRNLSELKGLERAKVALKESAKKLGRFPLYDDNGSGLIYRAIKNGCWEKYGIYAWCDILRETFGDREEFLHNWKGEGGLKNAKHWIQRYHNKHGKLPNFSSKHRSAIQNVLRSGEWKEYNIHSWVDLTRAACGKVPEIAHPYSGLKGLNKAKDEIKTYYKDTKKLPTCRTHPKISGKCSTKQWERLGIRSWNELLQDIFGKTNDGGVWLGREGLDKAVKLVQKISREIGKTPTTTHPAFSSVMSALYRKTWKEFGISSWRDLLKQALN